MLLCTINYKKVTRKVTGKEAIQMVIEYTITKSSVLYKTHHHQQYQSWLAPILIKHSPVSSNTQLVSQNWQTLRRPCQNFPSSALMFPIRYSIVWNTSWLEKLVTESGLLTGAWCTTNPLRSCCKRETPRFVVNWLFCWRRAEVRERVE